MAVSKFSDELTHDLMEQAEGLDEEQEDTQATPPTLISTSESQESSLTELSSVTNHAQKNRVHTKVSLKGGKQLRCIWCSRIHLIPNRKATIMYQECGVGFCRDETGRACW